MSAWRVLDGRLEPAGPSSLGWAGYDVLGRRVVSASSGYAVRLEDLPDATAWEALDAARHARLARGVEATRRYAPAIPAHRAR
jgi:hypothetical protein